MLVRIDAAPPGPLAVISELPDAKLAILEGLNGIGKTLAIRLLQICTGTLPYRRRSQAWTSLREGLGLFRVEITGLKNSQTIEWTADSTDWNRDDDQEPTSDWFRSITIDHKPASLEDVQGLLTVVRLAGDEGIIETFASLADADAATTRRWIQRYAAQKNSPLAALEDKAARALDLLRDWSAHRYSQITSTARTAADELASAKAADNEARHHRDMVVDAVTLRRRLSEIHLRTPELSRQLARVDEDIGAARHVREELQHELSALAAHLARTEPMKRELKNARRTLERNRTALTKSLSEATVFASRLGLVADTEQVEAAIDDLRQQLEGLHAEQTALDAAPAMRVLLDAVAGELADAEERGLGSQVALEDSESNLQLSVSETRVGMLTRRAYLEGQPPPPQARDVEQRFARASQDLDLAHRVLSTLTEAERFRQLVARNEDRVNRAVGLSTGPAASEAETLQEKLRSTDEVLMQLAVKRAELAQQIGVSFEGTSEEAVARQLAESLKRINVAEAKLDSEAEVAENAAAAAQRRLAEAQEHSSAIRREMIRANADIQRTALALMEDAELGWVHRVLGRLDRVRPGDRPEQLLVVLDRARRCIEAVVERLGRHRIQLAAVERALEAVARGLRGQHPEAVEYVEQLQSWLALRISDWFNNQRIRQELLPQSEGDIEVDVAQRQVTWSESSGKRSRPLEAFSSGEQAFAYTRARLALLDETSYRSLNRLIVLDEFGAFIAHDRLQGLLAYLQDRAKEHVHDQVLIVLPVSRDYGEMAESAVASEAKRFRNMAEQIKQRKYAVRVLVQ